MRELRARTDAFTESANAPRRFIVRIVPRGDEHFQGSLAVARAERIGAPRSVNATTCDEVVRAISFMVALVLDPDAKPPPTMAEAASADPGKPSDSVETTPSASTRPAEVGPPIRETTAQAATEDKTSGTPRWSARLSVDTAGMAAPGIVFGGGVGVGVRPIDRLELRASLHRTLEVAVAAEPTRSTFVWTFGRLEACLDLVHAGRIALAPCIDFDLGQLHAEGGGVRRTESPSRLWLVGGLDALARWSFLDPAMLELSAGLFAPLDRTEFSYRPTLAVYRPPAVGLRASLSVGIRWH